MIKAYNLNIEDLSNLPNNLTYNENKLPELFQHTVYTKQQSGKKVLDGVLLEQTWFNPINTYVFISHKSEDIIIAKKIAAFLQSKGLSCFIDSTIWGNIEQLQRLIDDDYCLNNDKTFYNYDKRNKTTSYVHMLLANALLKTIEGCKYFVFLNSKNSIKATDVIGESYETNSPWICFELNVANSLLTHQRHFSNESMRENVNDSLPEMAFGVNLEDFTNVTIKDFMEIFSKTVNKYPNKSYNSFLN